MEKQAPLSEQIGEFQSDLINEIADLRKQLEQKDAYIKSLQDHANYTRSIMHSLSNESNFNCETCG